MKKQIFFLLSILFIHGVQAQDNVSPAPCEPAHFVVAHRGAHNQFPENSFGSIEEAIALGVDMVEIDVRHTKDSILVLMHDESLTRTSTGTGLIENYTWEELQQFRLKNLDGTVTEEKIPAFKDVLEQYKGRILFDLDIKTTAFMRVVKTVEATETHASCYFLLDDLQKATFLKQRNKQFKLLISPKEGESIQSLLENIHPEIIHLNDKLNTIEINKLIHQYGSRSFINSLWNLDKVAVKDPELFERIYRNGADLIQTDYPELLLRHLRLKNLHK